MKARELEVFEAAANGQFDRIRSLIEAGADVNALDQWKKTPLHYAAALGQSEAVQLLIEHGADIEARDKWGKTPLDWAKQNGHSSSAQILEAATQRGSHATWASRRKSGEESEQSR